MQVGFFDTFKLITIEGDNVEKVDGEVLGDDEGGEKG